MAWNKVNGLLPYLSQKRQIQIQWRDTLYRDSGFYNYPLHEVGIHLTTYILGSSGDFVQHLNDGLEDGNLMWDFNQHQTYEKGSATREGFAEWVTIAGGFMSFVIRVSQLVLGRY